MSIATRLFQCALSTSAEPFIWTPPAGRRAVISTFSTSGTGEMFVHRARSGQPSDLSNLVLAVPSSVIGQPVLIVVENGEEIRVHSSSADTRNMIAYGWIEHAGATGLTTLGSLVAGTAVEPVFTATRRTLVQEITACNGSATTRTLDIHDVVSGQSATIASRLASGLSITPNRTAFIRPKIVLERGDSVQVSASAAGAIAVTITGFDLR